MNLSPAMRRYNRRVLWLSILYAVLLFGVVWLFRHRPPAGPIAYVIGVLPAIPVVGFFVNMGRYLIEEQDEYLRALQVRQLLIATGIALSASTIWGFLEGFGLLPHLPAYAWAVVWLAGLGAGACINLAVERRGA